MGSGRGVRMEASKESAEADTAVHGGASSSSTSGGGEDSGQNVPRDFDAVGSEDDSTPLGDDEEVETGPTVIVGEDGQEYMLLGEHDDSFPEHGREDVVIEDEEEEEEGDEE